MGKVTCPPSNQALQPTMWVPPGTSSKVTESETEGSKEGAQPRASSPTSTSRPRSSNCCCSHDPDDVLGCGDSPACGSRFATLIGGSRWPPWRPHLTPTAILTPNEAHRARPLVRSFSTCGVDLFGLRGFPVSACLWLAGPLISPITRYWRLMHGRLLCGQMRGISAAPLEHRLWGGAAGCFQC